ncbi:hypothetical protein TNCV_4825421 [Trichonephila clavipes]|uniref:Transposase n=1 Tax=Trichonephila clavipes TaxID=2585209 RepID=A0A8X6RMN8_TRICX|nr:hypothetical protein TNCV_4825421 [Trichonephila clavipes]
MEDDYDPNVDSKKELSLEQKLKLAMCKKNSTNQDTIQKSDISKTNRREIDLFEDERFRGKYLERRRFVEWAQNEIAVVPDFHKRILFSDEAHFWLNGYVNKQNCRIWSEANPQVYVETPLHPEKLFGALYRLVESFFKNDEGHNVTVNGDRYIEP